MYWAMRGSLEVLRPFPCGSNL
eukprot:SAG31_NODE_10365_length_1148_cov_1.204004_2_plen_21_part_01